MEKNWLIRHGWTFKTKESNKVELFFRGRRYNEDIVINKKEKYEIAKFLFEYFDGTEIEVTRALRKMMMEFAETATEVEIESFNLKWAFEVNVSAGTVTAKVLNAKREVEESWDGIVFDFINDRTNIGDLVEKGIICYDCCLDEDVEKLNNLFIGMVE